MISQGVPWARLQEDHQEEDLTTESIMNTGRLLSLVAIAGVACSQPRTSPVPAPPHSPAHSDLGCELAVERHGASLGLGFVLSNRSSSPRTVHYFRPFLQFDLRALAGGAELRIVRGDFDGPVEPATLDIPAGGTARLDTPVTLQFAATAAPPGDAFTWMLIGEPRALELRATLHLDDEPLPECVAHVDRG
jgi:hypothetical protein